MSKLFVNLPVGDLDASVDFFTKLGFTFDPQFTDENATSMIVGEDSFVMLLVEDFFQKFTKKTISDAAVETEAIIAVTVDSKATVDTMVATALANGGKESNPPQDQDSMYSWSFQDLDDHLWEVMWMDPSMV